MTDPNLIRWVHASVNKHFDGYKGNCYLHFEGTGRRQPDSTRVFWAELRCDGPYETGGTAGEENCTFEINVLICASIEDTYAYRIQDLQGRFGVAFTSCIPVKRYGDQPQDDQSLVGYLQLLTNNGEKLMVSTFGQIGPNTDLKQGSIEGHYHMKRRI